MKILLPALLIWCRRRTYSSTRETVLESTDFCPYYGRPLPNWNSPHHLITHTKWSTPLKSSKSAPRFLWGLMLLTCHRPKLRPFWRFSSLVTGYLTETHSFQLGRGVKYGHADSHKKGPPAMKRRDLAQSNGISQERQSKCSLWRLVVTIGVKISNCQSLFQQLVYCIAEKPPIKALLLLNFFPWANNCYFSYHFGLLR